LINKFFSKFSKKQQTIIILVVLAASVDALFIRPSWDRLSSVDREIESQENTAVRDLRLLSYKDRILSESNIYDNYFTAEVPEEDVINTQFFTLIESMANKANINLVKSNPADVKKDKNTLRYFANLDCNGSLNDIVSFMYDINSNKELLMITKFDLSPRRDDPERANATMTVVKLIVTK